MTDHTPEFIQPQLPFDEIPYGYCHCGCGEKTRISPGNDASKGLTKGQPSQFIRGHSARVYHGPSHNLRPLEERFWEKVDKRGPDECWPWIAALNELGYGHFRFDGKDYKAHRLAYILHYGPILDSELVCHECDNPPCCNWSHHFLGSHADNAADKVSKGRQSRGEHNGLAKVTELDVLEIRRLHSEGARQSDLAQIYGLSRAAINLIVHRINWSHLP